MGEGFNPCFSGCASLSKEDPTPAYKGLTFQSLF